MSTSKSKKPIFTATGSNSRGKSRKGAPITSIESQSTRVRRNIYGGPSRTLLSSAGRKNAVTAPSEKMSVPAKAAVQVFDDDGSDVTPLPLLAVDPNAGRAKTGNLLADSTAGTASIYQTGTVTASTFGGGPFTRSVFSASQSERSTGSMTDDLGEPAADMTSAWTDTKVQYKREEMKENLTDEDLEKTIEVNLTETPTIWLLDFCGVCVSMETEEAEAVQKQNSRYQELYQLQINIKVYHKRHDSVRKKKEQTALLIRSRVGNDRYMEKSMNTFNQPPKFKNVQTTKIVTVDATVNASHWDMYDTYKLVEEAENKAKKEEEEHDPESVSRRLSNAASDAEEKAAEDSKKSEKETVMTTSVATLKSGATVSISRAGLESQGTMSSMLGTAGSVQNLEANAQSEDDKKEKEIAEILSSDDFANNLFKMERVVNLNSYQAKLASYRGFQIYPDVDVILKEPEGPKPPVPKRGIIENLGPSLDRLWSYSCPLTKGHNISCIAWNKVNPDLLAVAYGQYEFSKQKSGLICCWSLKNPEMTLSFQYPERVYTRPHGITSLDFSVAHPNLLAAGLYDGTVAIYNVRVRKNEPILDSLKDTWPAARQEEGREAPGKHTGPVWQLRWIEKERGSGEERAEVLVSVSIDGRITQWSIRKGFENYDLMKLKRVSNKHVQGSKGKKTEAFISRYLAGTEDGHIHKCSCSYNEQYLDSYQGHTGPVYAVKWSPFCNNVFLSCSGDWTVRLWHQDKLSPILTFHSSTKSVPSVCWSPSCSTVFACVHEGAVEIWDLSQSTLDPIVVNEAPPGCVYSCVTFSRNSECILIGDSDGSVSVAQLKGLPSADECQPDALLKIVDASIASQLPKK
ncbi:hypothetical protein CAPTEDRAFT_219442 [Capitella teleta]|uniref:Dynein axonemal intermediate chain 4 n=1 Tax=Capitella teleta TaxID=283909 RepID=R7VHL4_CAPTE|nr:hypothetical protein CAPTEDRAFT_219442 [Capitella teleta]|eukprot:ELU18109.1 hypothetical protein CAPTEDRAFT_219442 [Capitella teleta]